MPISFPTTGLTPNVTTYTFDGRTWLWTGSVWRSVGTAQGMAGPQGTQGIQGVQGIIGIAKYDDDQGVLSQQVFG